MLYLLPLFGLRGCSFLTLRACFLLSSIPHFQDLVSVALRRRLGGLVNFFLGE